MKKGILFVIFQYFQQKHVSKISSDLLNKKESFCSIWPSVSHVLSLKQWADTTWPTLYRNCHYRLKIWQGSPFWWRHYDVLYWHSCMIHICHQYIGPAGGCVNICKGLKKLRVCILEYWNWAGEGAGYPHAPSFNGSMTFSEWAIQVFRCLRACVSVSVYL